MAELDELRAALKARYREPLALGKEGDRLVFAHESKEAAEAFAEANREIWGHAAWIEQRQVWVDVVDLTDAKAWAERVTNGG